METVCIICPKGCVLDVQMDSDTQTLAVKGHACPRGIPYGLSEYQQPMRMLTTTVKTNAKDQPRVPVKTSEPIPKAMIFEAMEVLNHVIVGLPVKMGDIVMRNLLGLKIDVVATMDFDVTTKKLEGRENHAS